MDEDGRIALLSGTVQDITHQKLAQMAVAQSEKRFRIISENSPDAIFLADTGGNLRYVNLSAADLLGYNSEELQSMRISDIIADSDPETLVKLSLDMLFENGSLRSEVDLRRKDGSKVTVELSAVLLPNGMAYGSCRDITVRRETERIALQQARLSALGQLASGIAHDFNNVLMPILGLADMLVEKHEDFIDDRQGLVDSLSSIRDAAEDARQIVKRLRMVYSPEKEVSMTVDLHGIVESAVKLTRPKWREEAGARGTEIRILTNLEPINHSVLGNASELREAIMNLIFNSVDAMSNGGTIKLSVFPELDYAVLEVEDSGEGMSEETISRCREAFFSTKGPHGSGLGLAMVNGIVERHSGSMEIESLPGEGTTIRIMLPFAEGKVETVIETQGDEFELKPQRILLVDDDEQSLELISLLLEHDGHEVLGLSGSLEALELIRESAGEFDIVISDRAMPGVNGDELLSAVKECSKETITILLTGFGDIMKASGEKPESVDRVVSKPVTGREMRSIISSLICRNGK